MFIGLVLIGIQRVPQAIAAMVGGSVGLVAAGPSADAPERTAAAGWM